MSNSGFFTAPIRLDCDWLSSTRKQAACKMNPPDITTITTSLNEGDFGTKGPEYYYLFASHKIFYKGLETTYHIVMECSKDIKGPYLNKDGESWVVNNYFLFSEGNHGERGRGQNGFFPENDTIVVLYHAHPYSGNGAPLLNFNPFYTDDEVWPTLDDTSGN